MKVRIHWVVGTAILATVCLFPLALWWYDFDHTWRVVGPLVATASLVGLVALLFLRSAREPLDKAIDITPQAELDALPEIPNDVFCPVCGYNLHCAPGVRCSECGYAIANIRSDVCRIPWARRREVGWFGGYWSTVWMVTFRNRTFCEEYARSVSFPDARAFQGVTVLYLYVPVLLATLLLYEITPPALDVATALQRWKATGLFQPWPTFVDHAYAEIWPVAVWHVCYVLFLFTVTAVPSYLLHSRSVGPRQQQNAVTLSYYTCGSLAFVPILFAILWGVIGLAWPAQVWPDWRAAGLSLGIAGAVGAAAWWWNLVRLGRRTMPQLRQKVAALAGGAPVAWLAFGILLLTLLPLAVLYVLVVVVSLWD